jgi:hypothetical protein
MLLTAVAAECRTEPRAAAGGLEAIPAAAEADRRGRDCSGLTGDGLAMSMGGFQR